MTTEATPAKVRLTDGLPEARWLWASGDRPYCDAYSADQMREYAAQQVAAERERLSVLVEAVRNANCEAEAGDTFRLLKPGQERAWLALLAGIKGPNA